MVDTRKIYEVAGRLETDTNNDMSINEIYTLIEILIETTDKEEITKCVNALQRINDKLYETYGLRDSILDFQVCINTLRSEYDVMDPDEVINKDADGVYVQ
jgi:hypothetical protein